ncbi:MAG: methylenetetrahydrofolate reductase [Oscillospiraceae bacterium]|nr:methylenetetrahydrofolate reductase [Oscillospiraceae bacterium]
MKINTLFNQNACTLSFEVFPPKASGAFAAVQAATQEMAKLAPHYMSVTYGAGGGTSENTVAIASYVQHELKTTALAHLTCVSSTREQVREQLAGLKKAGIENILALRGDNPEGVSGHYKYASELIQDIAAFGDFCVGAACYPEGHTQSASQEQDLLYLKKKVDCGVSFLCTQMFFDNNVLYRFLYKAMKIGIDLPVTAGIMPITNAGQIKRMVELSGATLPPVLLSIVDRFASSPAALYQAGIAYAISQILDLLANDIRGIHLYTMNKPQVARDILGSLSEVFSCTV